MKVGHTIPDDSFHDEHKVKHLCRLQIGVAHQKQFNNLLASSWEF